jgi:hypothetical protein
MATAPNAGEVAALHHDPARYADSGDETSEDEERKEELESGARGPPWHAPCPCR